jgi:hypothetical protein
MVLRSTEPITELSPRNIPVWGAGVKDGRRVSLIIVDYQTHY